MQWLQEALLCIWEQRMVIWNASDTLSQNSPITTSSTNATKWEGRYYMVLNRNVR